MRQRAEQHTTQRERETSPTPVLDQILQKSADRNLLDEVIRASLVVSVSTKKVEAASEEPKVKPMVFKSFTELAEFYWQEEPQEQEADYMSQLEILAARGGFRSVYYMMDYIRRQRMHSTIVLCPICQRDDCYLTEAYTNLEVS